MLIGQLMKEGKKEEFLAERQERFDWLVSDVEADFLVPSLFGYLEIAPGFDDVSLCNYIDKSNPGWIEKSDITECRLVQKYLPPVSYTFEPDPVNYSLIERRLLAFPELEVHFYRSKPDAVSPPESSQQAVDQLGYLINFTEFLDSYHGGYIEEPVFRNTIVQSSLPEELVDLSSGK